MLTPVPRQSPLILEPHKLPVLSRRHLEFPTEFPTASFFQVLQHRHTSRSFLPLPEAQLSTLLWCVAKTIRREQRADRLWEHRYLPSSGGLHYIYITVMGGARRGEQPKLELYDPCSHALDLLNTGAGKLDSFINKVRRVVDPQQGTVFLFVADQRRINAYYMNPSSLIWRDVGVVIAGFSLVSEALGLNCCPLGPTFDAELRALLDMDIDFLGCGGCIVGSRDTVTAAQDAMGKL